MTIGELIREIRIRKDISQKSLAERVGTRVNYLSDIELGKRLPGNKILGEIADVLDISPIFLQFYTIDKDHIKPEEAEIYEAIGPVIAQYVDRIGK